MSNLTTVTDNRIGNAILRKLCKENNVDLNNVCLNPTYSYVETVNFDKADVDFCKTEYKGNTYKVQYFSGCFNPYITLIS